MDEVKRLVVRRERGTDARDLAAEQGRERMRTQPSLEPGELEREGQFTASGGQEELGSGKDSESNFRASVFRCQTAMCSI